MSGFHILIADDEKGITDYLAPLLERAGYFVTVVYDGQTALRKIQEVHPDLIVLDVLMPRMNGREVCRQLRAVDDWTPVIILTRVNEMVDKVMSLEEGADDYLCKPFEPQELIARIKAVLRRKQSSPAGKTLSKVDRLKSCNLVLDRRLRRLEINGKTVTVTNKALDLLEYLMLHPGQIFTRDQLMDAVWGWSQAVASRAVDVRIAELRHALGENPNEPQYIETVIGVGYRFMAKIETKGNT